VKGIYDEEVAITSLRIPDFNDLTFFFVNKQNRDFTSKSYSGRIIKRFSSYFDASLMTTKYWIGDDSFEKTVTRLDFHGELFDMPVGLGLSLPLDKREVIKVCPRISFGDLITYLTVSEKNKDYILGADYRKWGASFGVAYDNKDIWHVRISKNIKVRKRNFFPEFRLKITPETEVFGFGLGMSF